MTLIELKNKLEAFVDKGSLEVEETGTYKFSTARGSMYGWDVDIYEHRQNIINMFRSKGYHVDVDYRFEVYDITVTKVIEYGT